MAKDVVKVNAKGLYVFVAAVALVIGVLFVLPRIGSNAAPSVGDLPSLGSKGAKVVIIEFSDYECPACRRAEPVLKQVIAYYGDRIMFSYRDFPIYQLHPFAQGASEAARCANDQGKFWEMHDKLFASEDLDAPRLKRYARELGIDGEKFDSCLDSRRYRQAVENDANDGVKAGVQGTPTFFINGKKYVGGRSFEEFKRIIDGAF